MSKITTLSSFTFGHTVNQFNRHIDFQEGGDELRAELPLGDYTLQEFFEEIAFQMSETGTQDYVGSVARATGLGTIQSPDGNFSLLVSSGASVGGSSAFGLMGFTGADRTGDDSYTGNLRSGKLYTTQFPMNNYTTVLDWNLQESSAVSVSASGVVQAVTFGDGRRMEGNIRLITNLTNVKASPFRESTLGRAEALEFMAYACTKARMEFMEDSDLPDSFIKVILESTPEAKDGTGFKLKNMGTPNFQETGTLLFREVTG